MFSRDFKADQCLGVCQDDVQLLHSSELVKWDYLIFLVTFDVIPMNVERKSMDDRGACYQ
jgi:hypothetical protein